MTAVQDGPTSITVTWTPPSLLGDTNGYIIGYIISYTDMSGNGNSETIGDGNSHTLTNLTNGETYMLSIVAKSSTDLVSESVHYMNDVPLSK